jgi:hypothetical protein
MVIKQEREIPSYLIFHGSVDLLLFSLRHLVGIVISPGAPARVTGFYEKVIKVKADVAAVLD